MTDAPASAQKKRKSFLSFLAWWKVDPGEVDKQVAEYESLGFWRSARGICAAFCILSVLITGLIGKTVGLSEETVAFEVIVWLVLAIGMYRGQRWAFGTGLVVWTIEKASLVASGIGNSAAPITQVIWWAIYMNAFYLGFVVERRRAHNRKWGNSSVMSASDSVSIAPHSPPSETTPNDSRQSTNTSPYSGRQERPCPWCAEPVLIQARYCKHCHRDIASDVRGQPA
jgi:hypothetical protein